MRSLSCPVRGTWIEIALNDGRREQTASVVPRKRHDGLLSNL